MKPHYLPRQVVLPGMVGFYRVALHPRLPLPLARRILDIAARIQTVPAGTVIEPVLLGDRLAERTTVGATERPRAVVYLHGGGFTIGSMRTHRSAVAYLAREAGAVVYSVDYRLAPEYPYPAAVDDGVAAFIALVDCEGVEPGRIAVSGDSAGGGIAISVARRLIDEHDLHPGALALFSPWADLADDSSYSRDLVVSAAWARRNGARYADGADPGLPGISPARGNLAGLPPMWVLTTVPEMLHDQVLRLVDAARRAGADVTLFEHPTLWHSGHTQASLVREAGDVIAAAGAYLRATLRS
jgi:epsilon-lactone hydrolase